MPMQTPKKYDTEEAKAYTATRSTWPEVIEFFLKYISSSNFLDAGCGTGNDLRLIYEKTGWIGSGCDGSSAMIAETQKKLPTADLRQADFDSEFPFSQIFDTIYTHDVIHHLKKPEIFFQNLYNHLSVGGVLCIGCEFSEGLDKKFTSLYFPTALEIDKARYPSYEKIHTIIRDIGFTDIEAVHIQDEEPFTEEIFAQAQTKSHSILRLITEKDFAVGLSHLEKDFRSGVLTTATRNYTLLAVRKA